MAAIFKLDREQQVSDVIDSAIDAFGKDILPFKFGFNARSRADDNESSVFARKLRGGQDKMMPPTFTIRKAQTVCISGSRTPDRRKYG